MALFHERAFTSGLNHQQYILKMLDFLKLLRDVPAQPINNTIMQQCKENTLFQFQQKSTQESCSVSNSYEFSPQKGFFFFLLFLSMYCIYDKDGCQLNLLWYSFYNISKSNHYAVPLNLHSDVCQLFLNKTGKEWEKTQINILVFQWIFCLCFSGYTRVYTILKWLLDSIHKISLVLNIY